MRDVASRAGVSLKTVSRVMNDEPGVSDFLATKVRVAAAELDFRPNLAASNLRRADQRTATIGLLIEDVANPFFALIHRGVEDIAGGRGVGVLSASVDRDPARERQLVAAFASRRVDGLVLVPTGSEQDYLAPEMRAGMPIVFVDREPVGVKGDLVLSENMEPARLAVRHLLERGHRDVAFLGGASLLQTSEQRYAGYLAAMQEQGLAVRPELIARDVRSVAEAEAVTNRLLTASVPPTALFTAQNLISTGAVRALHIAGAQHRVAMVGFDDFEFADVLTPAVTVIAQDPRLMGQLAAELVFDRIAGPPREPVVSVVPTQFFIRGSGEIRS